MGRPTIAVLNGGGSLWMRAGSHYIAVQNDAGNPEPNTNTAYTPTADALGGAMNPIIFPGTPSGLSFDNSSKTLSWTQAAATYTSFRVFYATAAGVSETSTSQDISLGEGGASCTGTGADRTCTYKVAGLLLQPTPHFFNIAGLGSTDPTSGNALRSALASSEVTGTPPPLPPSVSADGRRITFAAGATSAADNRVCATLPAVMDGEGALNHTLTNLPDWLEHRSDNGQQLCVKVDADPLTATTAPHISVTYTVREAGGDQRETTASITIRVNALPPPASSSSSGGAIALVAIAAGAYFWWKKRTIANGADPAKMALLPDVNFDLDRNDNRAFFTKINWKNATNSRWQIRTNLRIHTKYSGKLLDWNANSHLSYRLNGKFGDFNPYLRGKFVANDPENAEMIETYTLGVNYALPNRFSVQFLQPDDEIWRYSLKTQVQLRRGLNLNFARPNSDLPDFSLGLRYQNPQGFGVSITQPNSEISHYSLGIQWRGGSRIRYEFSGNTANSAIKLRGSFSF